MTLFDVDQIVEVVLGRLTFIIDVDITIHKIFLRLTLGLHPRADVCVRDRLFIEILLHRERLLR